MAKNGLGFGIFCEAFASNAVAELEQVSADGIYDKRKCYNNIQQHGAVARIPAPLFLQRAALKRLIG